MSEPILLAYIDEAGNVVPSDRDHILVVAALGMGKSPAIARIIRKAQKKVGSSLASASSIRLPVAFFSAEAAH